MQFSVVIPTYNREKVILRAIKSVLNQTIKDIEILIIDDGSKDNTGSVVASIKDTRIKYIKQRNSGANVARNTGILNSNGKYIAFLDSDDTFEATMLEEQLKKFESDDDVGFVYTNLDSISPDGEHLPFGIPFGLEGYCYKEALEQGYIAPTSVIAAKKDCFKTVGLFDESLPASQDDDMCFRLAKRFKVGYINKTLAHMYSDTNNRISNVRNPAKGWWMLWNKYENDVVNLCGKTVLAKHYKKCIVYFVRAKMPCEAKEAYGKFVEYGGRLGLVESVKFHVFIVTKGRISIINKKLLAHF